MSNKEHDMSEREFTKWNNKYKVWMALHPSSKWIDRCLCCKYNPSSARCSTIVTLSYDAKTDKIYNAIDVPNGAGCIEWIKHV